MAKFVLCDQNGSPITRKDIEGNEKLAERYGATLCGEHLVVEIDDDKLEIEDGPCPDRYTLWTWRVNNAGKIVMNTKMIGYPA